MILGKISRLNRSKSIDGRAMLRSKILMLIRKILMVRISKISITIFVFSLLADGTAGIPY